MLAAARTTAEDRKQEAILARTVAEKNSREIQRLSDARRLPLLRERAAALWPAHPDLIPDLEAWMKDADRLAAHLPIHQDSLANLRSRAESTPEGEYAFEREEDAWWFEALAR